MELVGQGDAVTSLRATPRLSIFPRDDALRAHAEVALESLDRCEPDALERALRVTYPAVRVRVRDEVARLGTEDPSWYVFREGVVRPEPPADRWQEADLPMFVISDDGTYVDANRAAAALVALPVDQIVGARIGSFTRHEPTDDAGMRVFATLASKGAIESTAVVVQATGDERPVEYRITRRPEGGFLMCMRERR